MGTVPSSRLFWVGSAATGPRCVLPRTRNNTRAARRAGAPRPLKTVPRPRKSPRRTPLPATPDARSARDDPAGRSVGGECCPGSTPDVEPAKRLVRRRGRRAEDHLQNGGVLLPHLLHQLLQVLIPDEREPLEQPLQIVAAELAQR